MNRVLNFMLLATATVTLGGCPQFISAQPLPKEDTPQEYLPFLCHKAIGETRTYADMIINNPTKPTINREYPKYLEKLQNVYNECPEDSKYARTIYDTEPVMENLFINANRTKGIKR